MSIVRYTLHTTRQRFEWHLSWRTRLRVALCVLLGRTFTLEGDFTLTGDAEDPA